MEQGCIPNTIGTSGDLQPGNRGVCGWHITKRGHRDWWGEWFWLNQLNRLPTEGSQWWLDTKSMKWGILIRYWGWAHIKGGMVVSLCLEASQSWDTRECIPSLFANQASTPSLVVPLMVTCAAVSLLWFTLGTHCLQESHQKKKKKESTKVTVFLESKWCPWTYI